VVPPEPPPILGPDPPSPRPDVPDEQAMPSITNAAMVSESVKRRAAMAGSLL
jgi:hypothetical protein